MMYLLRTWLPGVCLMALAAALGAAPAAAQNGGTQRSELPPFLFDPSYYSSRENEKSALYDGNQLAITFFNYGLLGGTGEVRGNWPKGSNDFYVGDVLPVIALEVPIDRDQDGSPDTLVHHTVTTRGPRSGQNTPPANPNIFWGFEAKPGFASDRPVGESAEPNSRPAISTDPCTWPQQWPDEPQWGATVQAECAGQATSVAPWNGFFGRGVQNADLESYYWMDDQNDQDLFSQYGFKPDSLDVSRFGQGLEVKVRGMQWSQFLAQDALFMLYEVTNRSTTTYPRVSVGLTVGTLAGGDGDSQDDMAFFDQANRIVYSWDYDDSGNEGQDVGYVGYGFMESPGDPDDGIDNDGDGDPTTEQGLDVEGQPFVPGDLVGTQNTFTAADFQPRRLQPGDPLVLIDMATGARSFEYVPQSGSITVTSQGRRYTVQAGDELMEVQAEVQGQVEDIEVTARNLIDEDLDGIIDEDVNLHFQRRAETIEGGVRTVTTLPALLYKNYVGFAQEVAAGEPTRQDSLAYGLLNPMIDEARDDGIDNDGDWDATDDVGADGVPGTGDPGEGDGRPTPGEPDYDELDVDESDQVGLSSFYYFTPPSQLPMNAHERLWDALSPGFFTTNSELQQQQAAGGIDGDFIFGSGYFALPPGRTLRFSMALVFGEDLPDITNNAITIQEIYDRNYNFARPPEMPTLSAVPGDGKVTLYWDDVAEQSEDPILGYDFEGYRLYRSTDPFFRDPKVVTDAFGNDALKAPVAQWDLENGVDGFWEPTGGNNLYERVRGVPFFLGDDTGLAHSYVDTTVDNGRRYYYALGAYDRGSVDFYPAENNFAVSVTEDGTVNTGDNVVEVTPNAPVLGFRSGGLSDEVEHAAGPATGDVFVEVLDARLLEDKEYVVTFDDGPRSDSFFVSAGSEQMAASSISKAEAALFDGLRLHFRNEATRLDTAYWQEQGDLVDMFAAVTNVSEWRFQGQPAPYDYEIRFAGEVVDTSRGGFRLGTRGPIAEATATYFTVYNTTLDRPAPFAFVELIPEQRNGRVDEFEFVFIYEEVAGQLQPSYAVRPVREEDEDGNFFFEGAFPAAGDVYRLETDKPFSGRDRYVYNTQPSTVEATDEEVEELIDRVAVVPNPYVAAADWERPLPPTITSGRGERRVDFIHLPADAVIRIYTARGDLVRELRHDSAIDDGTVSWDLRTREDLDVAYGIYFYYVEAPGGASKTGKIALIK